VRETLNGFREIWFVDYEFGAGVGAHPIPVCLVAIELRTGRMVRKWFSEFGNTPPYQIGPDDLFVAYYASAELGCHIALRWPMPANVLDLCAEFKNRFSGIMLPGGKGLVGALTHFGLDAIGAAEKEEMRNLALSIGAGAHYTSQEREDLLAYCQSDVDALARLLPVMAPQINLPHALLRGRYMAACARIEWNGVPVDIELLEKFKGSWNDIIDRLIAEIDAEYGVFDGRTFKQDKFAEYLGRKNIPWPRLKSGALNLDKDIFREIAKAHPEIATLHELRSSLSKMRLQSLAVGPDGRSRVMLSAFGSKRNQPSNSQNIFGPATWVRGLIKPTEGHGVAYIDWNQQEFGIAAALSGDEAMMEAYRSGDPYLALAKQAGAVPQDATKDSHGNIRDQYKTAVLGVQYGLEANGLARKIDKPPIVARRLLEDHRRAFPVFWKWREGVIERAMLTGELSTVFGWHVHPAPDDKHPMESPNERSLGNFPMQGNGAEMMRLACIRGTEIGIKICAPVHDAVLLEAPLDRLDDDVARMQEAMAQASRAVLNGFTIGSDAKIVRYPGRYMDKRGEKMCEVVNRVVKERGE
jgi:DNA polymerase I